MILFLQASSSFSKNFYYQFPSSTQISNTAWFKQVGWDLIKCKITFAIRYEVQVSCKCKSKFLNTEILIFATLRGDFAVILHIQYQ